MAGEHEHPGALLCAGRRHLSKGTVLHRELVELMVLSRAERAWGAPVRDPCAPTALAQPVLPSLSCLSGD